MFFINVNNINAIINTRNFSCFGISFIIFKMKFTSLLAVFALLQVSEAKEISCVRSSTGVTCSEQSSLFNILKDETSLTYYSYEFQVAQLTATQNWFTAIDTNKNNIGTWTEYY